MMNNIIAWALATNLIPVHAAHCPVHSSHRDGAIRVDGNHGSTLGFEPNSYGEWQAAGFCRAAAKLGGRG